MADPGELYRTSSLEEASRELEQNDRLLRLCLNRCGLGRSPSLDTPDNLRRFSNAL
jgi:hypothetical protein